jgi:hypothetical protein
MLRRVIQTSAFAGLLAMAAAYTFAATLGVILLADGLARASVVWPHIMPSAAVMPVDCCGVSG